MADAAGIAAITAGSTLIASGLSGTFSYLAAKRSTSAQLAAIEGEMDRLNATHEEEERRERKDLYVEFLSVVNRNIAVLSGSKPLDEEIYEKQAEEFSLIHAKMLLFATQPVIAELKPISDGFKKAGVALASSDGETGSFIDRAQEAIAPHEAQIFHGEGRLIGAMKLELRGQRFVDEIKAEAPPVEADAPGDQTS